MHPQNAFQGLMRRWTSLGPYNCLHLLQVGSELDLDRWRRSLGTALLPLDLDVTTPILEIHNDLIPAIVAELNRPFPAAHPPLRFFVVQVRPGDHYFGVAVDHWVADSYSIRLLMQRIFCNWEAGGAAEELPVMEQNTSTFAELFGRGNLPAALLKFSRSYLRQRRARRLPIHEPLNFSVGFQYQQLPLGLIDRVRQFAKQCDAKVNDVFLALAALALGKLAGLDTIQANSRARAAISVAVDLRPLAQKPLEGKFGFFLSYFTVLAPELAGIGRDDLVKQIAAQTRQAKSRKHALHLLTGFKIANLCWDSYQRPWRKALFLHRAMPVLGGISNVDLSDSWVARSPAILDYLRVSPAGPILPLAFTLTTIASRLSLCVTYRNAVFSDAQAAGVVSDFVQQLSALL